MFKIFRPVLFLTVLVLLLTVFTIPASSQEGVYVIDNDDMQNRLDEVRLGATAGIDTTTFGSMFFDNFSSKRFTFIGQ